MDCRTLQTSFGGDRIGEVYSCGAGGVPGFNTGSNIGVILLVGVTLKTIFWDLNGVGVVKEV